MDTLRLLLIEDDEDDFVITRDLFDDIESFTAELDWAPSIDAARERLAARHYDLCLLDYRLGGDDGLAFLRELLGPLGFRGPVLMLTGQDDRTLDARALEAGAADYLTKGELNEAMLDRAVRYALTRQQAENERIERLEAEARQHQAEAESRAKSVFLAHMSHELRTPLTAVLGYAELLATELDDPQKIEHAQTIQRNGRHLLGLLNDILDLSRIEADRFELEPQRIAPDELIAEVCELMTVQADDKGLDFAVEFQGKLPATILTDPTRLRQVLINLLGNAIKFTERGGVRLQVALQPGDPNGSAIAGDDIDRLRFRIVDTGPGIPRDVQARLFEPFVQGHDRPEAARAAGSGLGLTISQRLARLLGGGIEVDSEPGRGSTFTLAVAIGALDGVEMIEPRRRPPPPAVERRNRHRLRGRVLVVDDLADIRRLLTATLSRAGARVDQAADGVDALARVEREAADGDGYDLVILDMQMPRLNGYQTAERLRAGGFDRTLIALTAAAMRGERERCIAAGCDDYFSKPIQPARLVEAIAAHLGGGPDAAGPVLLVDDGDDAREATARLLRAGGHRVHTAATGAQALQQAEELRPAAVLIDIGLPDIDGYELARRIRALPALARARLIALTGHVEDRERIAAAGFDHYLNKPAGLDELVALLPPPRVQ